MHLVQILLPLRDKKNNAFPRSDFDRVRGELVERFGGATAYLQAPAQGVWKDEGDNRIEHDEIVVLEAMAEELDRGWWARYREELRQRFRQDELLVRAIEIETL